jgi:hypothetical protein
MVTDADAPVTLTFPDDGVALKPVIWPTENWKEPLGIWNSIATPEDCRVLPLSVTDHVFPVVSPEAVKVTPYN